MRTRRLLLATTALSTAALLGACKKDISPVHDSPSDTGKTTETLPLPGNPKGSTYDEGLTPTPGPDPVTADAAGTRTSTDAAPTPPPPPTATTRPEPIRMPGNPKGSHYDAGLRPKKSTP
jgi:hypothetical protein